MASSGVTRRETGSGVGSALAWFVSPHGLGHAARAAALMAACSDARPDLRHHLFTTVPQWFFEDSLPGLDLAHHRLVCDVGMVQADALSEDVEATVRALAAWLVTAEGTVDQLASDLLDLGCRAVVADIAPLGLAVARAAGLPGVLVENFTWDWIYHAYGDPGLERWGERLGMWFASASLRIQVEPVCRPLVGAVRVAPVSRPSRVPRGATRRRLGLRDDERMVLVGQGAGSLDRNRIAGLDLGHEAVRFVVPDPAVTEPTVDGCVLRMPRSGGPRHPDLVAASDVVVAKLGYSTVAEAFHAGAALAYLRRPRFPESPVLEAFVREHLPCEPLPAAWLGDPASGRILERVARSPRPPRPSRHGAAEAAGHILAFLHLQS
jgi:hypothetical protein